MRLNRQPGYRRWFVVVFAVSIFTAWGGWELVVAVIDQFVSALPKEIQFSIPFGVGVNVPAFPAAWLFGKSAGSILLGFLVDLLIQARVVGEPERIRELEIDQENREKTEQLLDLMIRKAGIDFTSVDGLSGLGAADQAYADLMREAVSSAKEVKILSIAGFQAIGSRHKSLLYELLRDFRASKLKVILLHPEKGLHVLHERAKSLFPEGHPSQTVAEIEKTRQALSDISNQREGHEGSVELRYLPCHPALRMLLTDQLAFVSAYQPNKHGHETPVFVFRAVEAVLGPEESFFSAFQQLFENFWEAAEPQDLTEMADKNPIPSADGRLLDQIDARSNPTSHP